MPRCTIVFWLFLLCSLSRAASETIKSDDWNLVFNDEFDSFDSKTWSIWNPNKHFDGFNTLDSVKIENGILTIYTKTENNLHKTCMISTENSFRAAQGKWECRARSTGASGLFNDFWLYTRQMTENEMGQEIDVFEHRLIDKNLKYIGQGITFSHHWGGYDKNYKTFGHYTYTENLHLDDDNFHIYIIEWIEDNLTLYIDGVKILERKSMSDQPLFALLSTEIINGWAGPVLENYNQKTLEVDYVRFYKRNLK